MSQQLMASSPDTALPVWAVYFPDFERADDAIMVRARDWHDAVTIAAERFDEYGDHEIANGPQPRLARARALADAEFFDVYVEAEITTVYRARARHVVDGAGTPS